MKQTLMSSQAIKLKERLREIRTEKRLTQEQAAEKIGVTQQTWHSAEKGKSAFPARRLERIAEEFEINLAWLITGEGNKTGKTADLLNIQERKLVKLVNGKTLAGLENNLQPKDEAVEDVILIPGLKSKKDCLAIQVAGRSMEPEIKEGATIILEPMEDKSEFQDNKTYVIILEGVPFLKKVSMILSGKEKGKFQISSSDEDRIQVVEESDIDSWYKVLYTINPI